MTDYSTSDLAQCAAREVEMRRRVYPNWVARGKMRGARADQEIAMMEAIAKHFDELAKKEQLL